MKRISSRMTRFYKYGFPLIWFGALAFMLVTDVTLGLLAKDPFFVILPCVMILIGTLVFRRLVWDLVDLVMDGGDFLLVRNRGVEEQIPLTNIMNVSSSNYVSPPRITLRLITPGSLGAEIAFYPWRPFSINPFARNVVADELILRVHTAKSRAASR